MADTKQTHRIITPEIRTLIFVLSFGWLVLGVSVGWLTRALIISASEGADMVAIGVIITLNIVAAISAFSIVIRPAILHRLQLRKRNPYTTKLRVVGNSSTPPR